MFETQKSGNKNTVLLVNKKSLKNMKHYKNILIYYTVYLINFLCVIENSSNFKKKLS